MTEYPCFNNGRDVCSPVQGRNVTKDATDKIKGEVKVHMFDYCNGCTNAKCLSDGITEEECEVNKTIGQVPGHEYEVSWM